MHPVLVETESFNPTKWNIGDLVMEFLSNQDVKQTSLDLYRKTLRQFLNWLDKREIALWEVDRKIILEYKNDLFSSKLSTLTVGSYLTAVRKFFQWTEAQKIYPNVAKAIKTPRRGYKGFKKLPLEKDKIQELLISFDRSTEKGKRDFAIVNLLLRTGLRTQELILADVGDITYRYGQTILKVQGKGTDSKEDQYVVLTEKSLQPIRDYLNSRSRTDSLSPLFCALSRNNKQEGRLSTRFIRQLVKDNLRSIGIDAPEFTAHSLRHTAGVLVLESGADLYSTQLFMRHSDPATTQIYLRTVEEKIKLANHAGSKLDEII